jgi:hypothetical protein
MAFKLTYNNTGTRNQPLSPDIAREFELAAQAAGIDEIRVTSGGQPSSGPNRTGSHRHDEGGAGDIQLVKDGRVLDFTDPNDLPYFTKFVESGKGAGLTGFGAGTDYMGSSTIHAGGGPSAVWGAGGSGQNAPDWLRQAYGTTLTSNPVSTSAPVTNTAGAGPFPEAPKETPYDTAMSGLGDVIEGLQPKPKAPPDETKIAPASISAAPAIPNPQAAQMLASLLDPRRTRGISLASLGMYS